ncbi:MAG: hypothetical protein ACO1NZ_11205 [Adhaeribacter sp.]
MLRPAFRSDLPVYLLTALLCVLARGYLLEETGLTDYDSVRNWQIMQEIGRGDFTHLFHHASPGFFLLFGLLAFFSDGVLPFIWLNMAFNLAGLLVLMRLCRHHLALGMPETFLLGLLAGLSVFSVSTGRNLATESLSVLLFLLLLERYLVRVLQQDRKALLQAAAWLALGLTVNYKLLLVLPVLAALELWQRDGLLNRRTAWQLAAILAAPYLVFAAVALALGQPFYRFPATVVSINHFTRPTPAQRTGRFNLDLLFYVRYLLEFEWPLLLAGTGLFPWLYRRELFGPARGRNKTLLFFFLVISLIVLGMHLLVKAPRGLMLVYGLLHVFTCLVLQRGLRLRWLVLAVLAAGVPGQLTRLQRHIYAYAPTSYPQVAAYLEQQGIRQVATTVGLNLLPYAQPRGIAVQAVVSPADLAALKARGFRYVLVDDYFRAAHVPGFEALRRQPALQAWPEPPLRSPLLYLDHAEFNGLGYRRVLANWQRAQADSLQLRLLRIP